MTMYTIKCWSRTTIDDNGTKSGWEYNGSFGANPFAWSLRDRKTLLAWSKMMDCFYQVMFVCDETNEADYLDEYED